MITCVSLNPSIDRTLCVDRFTRGGLNRVTAQTDVAAGKGVNVALAASALGARSECIGFMYRDGGKLFEDRLNRGGVCSDFLWNDGAVRVNIKVLDREKGEITEINSSGAPILQPQLADMIDMVKAHAQNSDYMILSGSLPPACPVDYYRVLADTAAAEGCRVLLDADGERLCAGLLAKPFLIKPNRYELELLTGKELESVDAILEAALECVRGGVGAAAISMGADGALMTDGKAAYYTPGLKVEIQSTVAAGDSMIAGLAVGFERGYGLSEAFRMGVAAATARCCTPPDQIISAECCLKLADQLQMERLF